MVFLNKILILILACVLFSAHAVDYYISDISGNDQNDGSSQSPWKSINKLATHSFQPGIIFSLKKGILIQAVLILH